MKCTAVFMTALAVCLSLVSCSQNKEKTDITEKVGICITDVYGNTAYLPENPKVVSCYGSFSECWLLSGGTLVGVTDDAVNERGLDLQDDVEIVGTVKDINLEKTVSLDPDYVILSADITAQASLAENFDMLDIPYGYFRVDSFGDYADMMEKFCNVNGKNELYDENVTEVENQIKDITASVSGKNPGTYLLMRVYSTGIKVKTDNIADRIIKDLGGQSITDKVPSLLTDFSIEEVIRSNPDYIFVLTMGDEKAGEEYFYGMVAANPAWQGLDAVKNGNCRILPKELFHYKPNNRWAESYRYIAEVLYPENTER